MALRATLMRPIHYDEHYIYCKQLIGLVEAECEKYSVLANCGEVIFCYGNTGPHVTQEWEIFHYSPHSPDIPYSDYSLFGVAKIWIS